MDNTPIPTNFLSSAHAMKNSIATVQGFLQLLKETKNADSKNYIDLSLDELKHMNTLIQTILLHSSPAPSNMEKIRVVSEIQHVMDLLEPIAKLKVSVLQAEFGKTETTLLGSVSDFKQIITNLLKNAIESVDQNGLIIVRVYARNDFVCIAIIDNGKGIPNEQLQLIGTPFYTTKKNGSGIGIFVTQKMVEKLNGTLHMTSIEGTGSTFTLSFPKNQ